MIENKEIPEIHKIKRISEDYKRRNKKRKDRKK
jgi:hypothetical protein